MLRPHRQKLERLLGVLARWLGEYGLALLGIGFFVLAVAAYVRAFGWPDRIDRRDWTHFADFLSSALTPLLLFLLLIGVLQAVTVMRREFEATRIALERSSRALEVQERAVELQSFEARFFDLLRLFDRVAGNLQGDSGMRGREALRQLWQEFRGGFAETAAGHAQDRGGLAHLSRYCVDFFGRQADLTSHYFATLAGTLAWLDRAPVQDTEPYMRLLRGMLSRAEASLIFYLCLARLGEEDFPRLARRHNLLGDLSLVDVVDEGHRALFR